MSGVSPETAAAAVSALQAQLDHAIETLEALDNKASLVPVALIALAGLLLPTDQMKPAQVALTVSALVVGVMAVLEVAKQIRPGSIELGPNTGAVLRNMGRDVADFQELVAGSLADAIESAGEVNKVKAESLTRALEYTGWAIFLLVLTRVAGGL